MGQWDEVGPQESISSGTAGNASYSAGSGGSGGSSSSPSSGGFWESFFSGNNGGLLDALNGDGHFNGNYTGNLLDGSLTNSSAPTSSPRPLQNPGIAHFLDDLGPGIPSEGRADSGAYVVVHTYRDWDSKVHTVISAVDDVFDPPNSTVLSSEYTYMTEDQLAAVDILDSDGDGIYTVEDATLGLENDLTYDPNDGFGIFTTPPQDDGASVPETPEGDTYAGLVLDTETVGVAMSSASHDAFSFAALAQNTTTARSSFFNLGGSGDEASALSTGDLHHILQQSSDNNPFSQLGGGANQTPNIAASDDLQFSDLSDLFLFEI